MKVLVTTKSAIDYQVKIVVKPDGSGVETDGVQMSMNPFDAIAVEACCALQEANHVAESTAITIGEDTDVLYQALAMGIHQACHIPQTCSDPYQKALLLHQYIKENHFDLIIMGKLGIDGDHSQIPAMLAGMLSYPLASNASNIQVDGKRIIVDRETDAGILQCEIPTPGIISCDLRLNTPRFVALPKLLQAKKQSIEVFSAEANDSPHTILSTKSPQKREGNPPVDDLDTFINNLKDGGIIE